MATEHLPLTAQLIQQICGYIKGGAFEQTACEVAGVPHEVFMDWLSQARQKSASTIQRLLLQSVRQARAQARLKPEMQLREDSPRQWLLHGPGKQTPDSPGWSAAPRAAGGTTAPTEQFAARMYEMIMAIHQALKPFPDARMALEPIVARFFPDAELSG
jgi:hypothetical protein